MSTVGKFLVEDTFHLQLRGLVILGLIVDGVIDIGYYIHFDSNNRFKIKDFGYIRDQSRRPLIGLLISDAIIAEADLDSIKGQELTITSQ